MSDVVSTDEAAVVRDAEPRRVFLEHQQSHGPGHTLEKLSRELVSRHIVEVRCFCGERWTFTPPVPVDSTEEQDAHAELRLTQMRAAVVECCEAGRVAYPDACPWHDPKETPK